MPTTPAMTKDLPLPVRIFLAAMEQQLSLADYAQRLGISSDSLRAIVTAQLNQVEPAILDHLADVYKQSRETLRDQLLITPPQESFAAWLKRNMEGISQHALRTRVQLDAKTLKRFLHAEMLPDSDQAERLARALYIDRTELAQVVTANMVNQADSERLTATTSTTGEQRTPSPTTTREPTTVRSGHTQRQKALPAADSSSAQGAAATGAIVVEPALEGEHPRRAASRRQGGTKAVDAVREPVTAPEGDRPRRPAARGRAGTTIATGPSAPTAAAPMNPTHKSGALGVERPQPPAARRRTTPRTGVPATPPTADSTIGPVPETAVKQPRPQAARRQAGTAALDRETTTTPIAGALTEQNNPTTMATASTGLPASDAPNQRTIRKQRRAGPVSTQGAADVARPVMIARAVEPPTSEGAAERDPTAETAPRAAPAPAAIVPPAELAMQTDGAVPRTPPADVQDLQLPTADPSPVPVALATASADTQRSQPQTASTSAAPDLAAVASVLAVDTTTLQLTPDEVRLIRHWRQLHPHGRRATLHYIGSLLVEE